MPLPKQLNTGFAASNRKCYCSSFVLVLTLSKKGFTSADQSNRAMQIMFRKKTCYLEDFAESKLAFFLVISRTHDQLLQKY